MDIELLPITFAANETKHFARAGRRIDVIDAPYSLAEIALADSTGGAVGFVRNSESGIFAKVPFTTFAITNGPTAQTIRLLVTDGDGGTNRLPGVVRVVDQGAEKTQAGAQFCAAPASTSGAPIRVIAFHALTRPFAAKRISVVSDVAGEVQFFTAQGNPIPANTVGAIPNKLAGAAAVDTVSHRFSLASAQFITAGVDYASVGAFATLVLAANVLTELPLTTPFVLPVGWAIGVNATLANRALKLFVDGEVL